MSGIAMKCGVLFAAAGGAAAVRGGNQVADAMSIISETQKQNIVSAISASMSSSASLAEVNGTTTEGEVVYSTLFVGKIPKTPDSAKTAGTDTNVKVDRAEAVVLFSIKDMDTDADGYVDGDALVKLGQEFRTHFGLYYIEDRKFVWNRGSAPAQAQGEDNLVTTSGPGNNLKTKFQKFDDDKDLDDDEEGRRLDDGSFLFTLEELQENRLQKREAKSPPPAEEKEPKPSDDDWRQLMKDVMVLRVDTDEDESMFAPLSFQGTHTMGGKDNVALFVEVFRKDKDKICEIAKPQDDAPNANTWKKWGKYLSAEDNYYNDAKVERGTKGKDGNPVPHTKHVKEDNVFIAYAFLMKAKDTR